MQDPQPNPRPAPAHPLESVAGLFERARSSAASLGKLILVGVMMALLHIPVDMVQGLIRERETRRGEAEAEVSGRWGGPQALTGPILTVPYRTYEAREEGVDTVLAYAHFLPETLAVTGAAQPEIRRRGIFEVALFRADLEVSGAFLQPSFAAWKVKDADVLWEDAFLTLSVPDLRQVADARPMEWRGDARALAADNLPGSPVGGGLQVRAPLAPGGPGEGGYAFRTRLGLNGSGMLGFLPMGQETRVSVRSPWSAPSFTGAYLPVRRTVDAAGFEAEWKTFRLSRGFPRAWRGQEATAKDWDPYLFGVELKLPVESYRMAERCAKYATLFILLTFLVFFLHESFDRRRIHPLQYLLVGFALCLFYLLLLSLSEHIPFASAYAAAAAAVVGLVSAYSAAVLAARKRALGLGALLAALYAYLYTLLQMEDYALLMGSLGLFLILAGVMYATRRLDWYGSRGAPPGIAPQ